LKIYGNLVYFLHFNPVMGAPTGTFGG